MLPELPELPGVIGAGAGAGVGLVLAPPEVLPDELPPVELPPVVAPAPAPLRWSRWHFSSSAPVSATHLSLAPVLAEPDAPVPDEPEALPLAPVLPLLPLPDVPAPTLEPDVPLAPVDPVPEPEDWPMATEDRARSAAAVAAVSVFNIMVRISSKGS